MIKIIVSIACLALASTANAASYEPNNDYETVPQSVPNDPMLDGMSQPNELGLAGPAYRADRIRSALARFFVAAPNLIQFGVPFGQLPDVRIRTRSAPKSPELQDISQLLDSIEVDHSKEQRSVHRQQPQQPPPGSSHKSLRNIQSVFMRLPPRFGK